MQRETRFRPARIDEAAQAFEIVAARVRWMDENGIRQWNVSGYTQAYPPTYYETLCREGALFVLTDAASDEILCIGALKDKDDYWREYADAGDEAALYLHNFAAKPTACGAGGRFLECAERYALQQGKTVLRLDSAEDNLALARYYEKKGFVPVGKCADGPYYSGILRQKRLNTAKQPPIKG